jgi:hypothetical protein
MAPMSFETNPKASIAILSRFSQLKKLHLARASGKKMTSSRGKVGFWPLPRLPSPSVT